MNQEERLAHATLILRGEDDGPLSVQFEPTGGEYVLRAGEFFRLVIEGPTEATLEVTHGAGYISVWPSPKLSVTVYDSAGHLVPVLGY